MGRNKELVPWPASEGRLRVGVMDEARFDSLPRRRVAVAALVELASIRRMARRARRLAPVGVLPAGA